MKFICEKDKLLIGLNSVSRASVGRTTTPILEGIFINVRKNTVILTTNDLDIGMEYTLDDKYRLIKEEKLINFVTEKEIRPHSAFSENNSLFTELNNIREEIYEKV